MVENIKVIEESWKFAGYCFITTVDGKIHKRKMYPRKTGKLAGRILVNLNTDVYSFRKEDQTPYSEESNHSYKLVDIQYVGNYKTIEEAIIAQEIETPKPEVKTENETDVRHEKFETIKSCVEANIPVFLVGPAGSGKNFTLEQIAWELGLEFFFTNSIQQEYKLTGFIDAGGTFHETEFYKAFTKGGLFFLDEMDASIPEILVLLNAAIANKYFEFPNGRVNANENFRIVAAGNTMGNGADEQYTGRLVLDQATLDRFAIIEFDYSRKIELHLAKGDNNLVNFIRDLRKQASEKGIRATFSYRCISMVVKLEGKIGLEEVIRIAVLKGFDKDTMNTFNLIGSTKYHIALRKVQAA